MPEDIEVRVEQLGAAIAADPEAFKLLLEGVAGSMQDNASDLVGEAASREEREEAMQDFHQAMLVKQIDAVNFAAYAE